MSTERLVPVEVLSLTFPHDEHTAIISGSKRGEITATCIDGRALVKLENQPETEFVDLGRLRQEFVL